MVQPIPRVRYACYRILQGDDIPEMEKVLEDKANLVNDYGGTIHGVQPLPGTFLMSFNIPASFYDAFLKEEVRQNEGATKE